MAWAKYRKTVAEITAPPGELMLFCGMSIGYEDVAERYTRTGRAPLEETVTYIGDENGTRSSRLLGAVSGSDRW
jgi:hypothetical protein